MYFIKFGDIDSFTHNVTSTYGKDRIFLKSMVKSFPEHEQNSSSFVGVHFMATAFPAMDTVISKHSR